jgi:hypothetical protein
VKTFKLPDPDSVFVDSDDGSGDRGSPGNEDLHYRGDVQPIDLIESQGLNFSEGNIVKLVCRYRDKAGLLDLGKLVFYAYRLIFQWLREHPQDKNKIKWG